jgi:redox-sensitive bicupin YhaK (pirin superfamily)
MLQPLPTWQIDHLDPFLLLHHHGPNTFEAGSKGLEVGAHPHKGIETVTVVVQGDTTHLDNLGNRQTISAGGIHWMTAGRGILHDEGTSDAFNSQGGTLEILQLWLNLPASLKNTEPGYAGYKEADIPTLIQHEGKAILRPLSGIWEGLEGPHKALTDVHLALVTLESGAMIDLEIPSGQHLLCYAYRGEFEIEHQTLSKGQIATFQPNAGTLIINGIGTDNRLLLGYGSPYDEPIVAHGPFVMNTQEEIRQAYEDFRRGRFGTIPLTQPA